MPVQYTILGKPIAFPSLPRRMIALFGSIFFFGICFYFLTEPTSTDLNDGSGLPRFQMPTPGRLKEKIHGIEHKWKDMHTAVHKPVVAATNAAPVQANSSSGDARWYSNWKWKNPFSYSVTLDENRAVLPPLRERPPIYTFYDMSIKRDDETRWADNQLLLQWRRAWWAQGFKPMVLGRPEAMNNPLYEQFQRLGFSKAVEEELARWLAWENMGTGILANYLALPMAPYDDDLLTFLRRGEYPTLMKFKSLGNGLFCGEKTVITKALQGMWKKQSAGGPPKSSKSSSTKSKSSSSKSKSSDSKSSSSKSSKKVKSSSKTDEDDDEGDEKKSTKKTSKTSKSSKSSKTSSSKKSSKRSTTKKSKAKEDSDDEDGTASNLKSMIDGIGENSFQEDSRGSSIAYYTFDVIEKSYPSVYEHLTKSSKANGLFMLAQLINAHLHQTWQNTFPRGIDVIKPFDTHMAVAIEPAIDLARNLTQCPSTPETKSCPPNNPRCSPCNEKSPLPIVVPATFNNDSRKFSIGFSLHPYTLASLVHDREDLDIPFIRKSTQRDDWLAETMRTRVPPAEPAESRVVLFKEAVASQFGESHSLWLTAERDDHKDLNWVFGFDLPRAANAKDGATLTPSRLKLQGPGERPPLPKEQGPKPYARELKHQRRLIKGARTLIHSNVRQATRIRDAAEAWNMYDAEAWKFARAFSARRRMERLVWEEEERKFAGAEQRAEDWGGWLGLFKR